jgi:hypothetical protein
MADPKLYRNSTLFVDSSNLASGKTTSYKNKTAADNHQEAKKTAGFGEVLKVVRDRMAVDFVFRGAIHGAWSHLYFYLTYTLGLFKNGFAIFASGLMNIFLGNIVWTMGAFLFYGASQCLLGKNAKPWQFYLLFEGKKEWNWKLFKEHLVRAIPSIVAQFVLLSLLFPPYVVMLTAAFTALYAPFVFVQAASEEVMDRNLMIKMMDRYGFVSAGDYVVLSSITFALAHFVGLVPYAAFFPVQALIFFSTFGAVMARNAYFTQGIEVSSVDHTLHNLMLGAISIACVFATPSFTFVNTGLAVGFTALFTLSMLFIKPDSNLRHYLFSVPSDDLAKELKGHVESDKIQKASASVSYLVALNMFSFLLPAPVSLGAFVYIMMHIREQFESLPLMPKWHSAGATSATTLAGDFVQGDVPNKTMPGNDQAINDLGSTYTAYSL